MSLSLEQVQAEALGLTPSDRGELIQILSASLDDEPNDFDAVIESSWAGEIRSRVEDYAAGRVRTVSGDEVLARLRRELKENAASG